MAKKILSNWSQNSIKEKLDAEMSEQQERYFQQKLRNEKIEMEANEQVWSSYNAINQGSRHQHWQVCHRFKNLALVKWLVN